MGINELSMVSPHRYYELRNKSVIFMDFCLSCNGFVHLNYVAVTFNFTSFNQLPSFLASLLNCVSLFFCLLRLRGCGIQHKNYLKQYNNAPPWLFAGDRFCVFILCKIPHSITGKFFTKIIPALKGLSWTSLAYILQQLVKCIVLSRH